jgi:hypothetical protein
LKPNEKWNGDKNFEFTIGGHSDLDFLKDPGGTSIIVCACGRGRLRSHAVRTSGVGSIEILAQN